MEPQQSTPPAYQPPVDQPTNDIAAANKKRKVLALWLLIGPTALSVASIILYAIVNFILGGVAPDAGSIGDGGSPIRTILNVILFLVGIISFLTWLPGIIAGIILLTTQKKS